MGTLHCHFKWETRIMCQKSNLSKKKRDENKRCESSVARYRCHIQTPLKALSSRPAVLTKSRGKNQKTNKTTQQRASISGLRHLLESQARRKPGSLESARTAKGRVFPSPVSVTHFGAANHLPLTELLSPGLPPRAGTGGVTFSCRHAL